MIQVPQLRQARPAPQKQKSLDLPVAAQRKTLVAPPVAASAPQKKKTADVHVAPPVAASALAGSPSGGLLTYGAVLLGDVGDLKVKKTLCGEYTERGSNQGKKVFVKTATSAPDGAPRDVFLYYWDTRDGDAFQGWWFGGEVGGTQVWAHAKEDCELPPKQGWRVPHDGPVCKGFSLLDSYSYKQHRKNAATRERQEVEKRKRVEVLKARRDVKIQDRKEEEAEQVQALIDEASKRVDIAEDLLAKALAAVAEVKQAYQDQEELPEWLLEKADSEVKNAATVLCQAQVQTGFKLAALQREAKEAEEQGRRNEASEEGVKELVKLQERLTKAQQELKPLKNVRADSQRRVKATKLRKDLERLLSEVEMKLDDFDAKEFDYQDKDVEDEAKAQLDTLREMVSEAKVLFGKRPEAEALLPEDLPEFDKRVEKVSKRVAEAEQILKQAMQKRTVEGYVVAANDKMKEVAEAFDKVELAAHPILHDDTLEFHLTIAFARSTEEAAIATEATIASVKKFVASKMLEIRRIPAKIVAETTASLQDIEKELDGIGQKLRELRSRVGDVKRKANVHQARTAVEHAETLAEAVVETAHVIADGTLLSSLSASEVAAAKLAIAKAEKQANNALVEAQKAVTARQMDTRGSDIPAEVRSELASFQTRIGAAGVKVAKQKKLVDSIEQRKSCALIFKEAEEKMQVLEGIVVKAIAAAADLEAKATTVHAVSGETTDAGGNSDEKSEEKVGGQGEDDRITEQAALLKTAEETIAAAHASIKDVDHFLGSQMTTLGPAALEVAKLSARVKQALVRLCTSDKALKTRSENIVVSSMILECKSRAKEAAEALQKAVEAESVCGGGLDRLPCHAVMKAVGTLETTTQEASTLVGNTKTFLAMKRIAVKKMSASAFRKTTEAFSELQTQMDSSGKRLHELRSSIPPLKKEAVKLEAGGFVATAQKLTEGAKQATAKLASETDEISTEDMKIETAKVDSAQESARKAIAGFLKLMEKRRKSAEQKQDGEEVAPSENKDNVGEEFLEAQRALEKAQAELEQQRASLTKSEHRFVSRMLVAEARISVEGLESKMKGALDLAAQLLAEPWKDFAASLALIELIRAFKVHLETRSETPLQLVHTLIGKNASDDGVVTEARFTSFMKSMSEDITGIPEYPEDQLSAIFAELVKTCGGTIVQDSFLELFECRYRCMATVTITDSLEIKAAKTIRKLEVDEIVVAQGELHKDEKIGLQRVLGVAEKDNAKGWISVSGNQGKVFLKECTPYDDCLRQVDSAVKSLQKDISSTSHFLSEKAASLKPVRTGPLAEAKAEIAKMQTQATQTEKSVKVLKDKIIDSMQKHGKHMGRETARHKKAADKRLAATIVVESTSLIEKAENETSQVFAEAEALLEKKETGQTKDRAEMQKRLADSLQTVAKATHIVQAKLASSKSASTGPLADTKEDMLKLKVRLGSIEVKCKRLHEAVSASLV